MASKVLDQHMQFAVIEFTFSADLSNVRFQQLVTGLTNMQKMAWAIKRLEYELSPLALDGMVATGEYTEMALTQSASLINLSPMNASLVDKVGLVVHRTPTADSSRRILDFPIVHDFGTMDKLIVPQNVYLGVAWSHTGAPSTSDYARLRIWYHEIELGSEDWYDLLQLRMPLGAL